jgi:serine/threonine protein kinase
VPFLSRLKKYRDYEFVAQGGMGAVYRARQRRLLREVALKLMPLKSAGDPLLRRRFLREAQLASSLHHGHIVPVHDSGVLDSTLYYAMKFIAGVSLAKVLRSLREYARGCVPDLDVSGEEGQSRRVARALAVDSLEWRASKPTKEAGGSNGKAGASIQSTNTRMELGPAYARAVARLCIPVAEALHYSHSNGVIHGDVKPGNLLIDLSGKIWLTDFGLAVLRKEESEEAEPPTGGTRHYMSPEQASSHGMPFDFRSDIYSLGATLYELATLHQPAAATNEPGFRPLERPRKLRKSIPRELETIILKAMEPEAMRRYETAGDFADDLRRFCRGEAILAQRASIPHRVSRFVVRKWKVATIGATVTALAIVGALAVLIAANQRSQAGLRALREVLASRTLATEHLTESIPLGSDRVHLYLMENLRAYEVALNRVPDGDKDPEIQYWVAMAHYHVGRSFQSRLGDENNRSADWHYTQAVKKYKRLTHDDPQQTKYRRGLFRAMSARGSIRSVMNKHEEAGRDSLESLAIIDRLSREKPEKLDLRDAMAFQEYRISTLFLHAGRSERASEHARRCVEIAEWLLAQPNTKPLYLNNLYRGWFQTGLVREASDQLWEAEAAYREALRVNEECLARGPDQLHYPFERTATLRHLAKVLLGARRFDEARSLLEEAIAEIDDLCREFSYNTSYLSASVHARCELARVLNAAGQTQEGQSLAEATLKRIESIIAKHPNLGFLHTVLKDCGCEPSRSDTPQRRK